MLLMRILSVTYHVIVTGKLQTSHVQNLLNIRDTRERLRQGKLTVFDIPRFYIGNTSSNFLVEEFISRDKPFVLKGLPSNHEWLSKLLSLANNVRRTNKNSQSARKQLKEIVTSEWWPFAQDWVWYKSSEDEEQWGCKLKFPQCTFSYWPLGRKLDDPTKKGGFQDANGVKPHTDAICVPSWSLQLHGRKEWLFSMRAEGDSAPLGDTVDSLLVHRTVVSPGEILIYYNGWVTHTTEVPMHDPASSCGSLHGVLYFDGLIEALWGSDAMRARCGKNGCASLTPGMGDKDGRCIADILKLNPHMRLAEQSNKHRKLEL